MYATSASGNQYQGHLSYRMAKIEIQTNKEMKTRPTENAIKLYIEIKLYFNKFKKHFTYEKQFSMPVIVIISIP